MTKSERTKYTTFSEKSLNFYPQRGENVKKVKSKLSTFMQNFVAMGLLMLLTLLLCFATNPFEKTQPKTIDAVSIMPSAWKYDESRQAYFAELGIYPQTYVGDALNSELVTLLNDNKLTPTGNTYISNNRARSLTVYEEKQNKEYEYNDKLYVAVENQQHVADSGGVSNPYFSTGDPLGNVNETKFFKVEPIKWYIIDGTNPQTAPEGTQCRVISDLVLNAMPFNAKSADGNVWKDSLIREYLNGNFYQSTGLANEDVVILQHNENNKTNNATDGSGPATDDYVYLLSYQEMNGGQFEFLDTNEERITTPTDFALSNGAVSYNTSGENNYRLRSASIDDCYSYNVLSNGSFLPSTYVNATIYGVRPALTLDLDSMPVPEEVEPIYISTAGELKQLSDYSAAGGIFNPNWKFYLTNDIDMSGIENFMIGGNNPFTGYFNGQGHTISNLNFNTSLGVAAMFAAAQDCTIINLNLVDNRVHNDISGTFISPLIGGCQGEILISNVTVNYNALLVRSESMTAGLIAMASPNTSSDIPLRVTITDCEVVISKYEGMHFGGLIGQMCPPANAAYSQISISRCMVSVGEYNGNYEGSRMACFGGVCAAVEETKGGVRMSVNVNQFYVSLGTFTGPTGGTIVFGGLFGFSGGLYDSLTYNEVACSANISCENPSQINIGYEWAPVESQDVADIICSVVGTNSYFNFTGNVAADFTGVGRYAGVFDVAREQYYSGFSDNEWVVFPNTHPTIREFMAIGDFAPIASVEDKLIELGYTRVM